MNALNGTWDLTMKTPIGTIAATYVFRQDEQGRLQGEAHSNDETMPLQEIVVEEREDGGLRVRWSQRVTKPMRLNLDYDVVVESQEMTGFSRAGRLPRTKVRGRRAAGDGTTE